jgi:hypothetical protein
VRDIQHLSEWQYIHVFAHNAPLYVERRQTSIRFNERIHKSDIISEIIVKFQRFCKNSQSFFASVNPSAIYATERAFALRYADTF